VETYSSDPLTLKVSRMPILPNVIRIKGFRLCFLQL
jgi:hypothetical protein